jgi:hypothetical protein
MIKNNKNSLNCSKIVMTFKATTIRKIPSPMRDNQSHLNKQFSNENLHQIATLSTRARAIIRLV